MLRKVAVIGGLTAVMIGLSACTIDPSAVAKDVQAACQIEVSISDIAKVISDDPVVKNAEAIAAMICQAFVQSSSPPASTAKAVKPAKGAVVHFHVVTQNGQDIPITATVQ